MSNKEVLACSAPYTAEVIEFDGCHGTIRVLDGPLADNSLMIDALDCSWKTVSTPERVLFGHNSHGSELKVGDKICFGKTCLGHKGLRKPMGWAFL